MLTVHLDSFEIYLDLCIPRFDKTMYRMSNANIDSGVDFFDDLTPLSTALIDLPAQPPVA